MLIAMLWTILSLNQGVARVSCEPELSKLESGGTWEIQVPYPLGASDTDIEAAVVEAVRRVQSEARAQYAEEQARAPKLDPKRMKMVQPLVSKTGAL